MFPIVAAYLVLSVSFSTALPNDFGKIQAQSSMISYSRIVGRYDLFGKETTDGNARFLILGDWGGLPFFPYTTPSEEAVAHAMGVIAKNLNTSFQLALGDNFYYHGVQSVDDPRFEVRPQ